MSVIYVQETWDGRSGADTIDRVRDYVRTFEVRTSSASDDATVAGGPEARALGLPGNGYPYPLDSGSFVVKIDPNQHADDPTLWTVTIRYTSQMPARQAGEAVTFDPKTGISKPTESGTLTPNGRAQQIASNPIDRSTKYSIDYEEYDEIVTHTWRGWPIVNSADDMYDHPPPTMPTLRPVIVVEKIYPAKGVDLAWLDNFADSVNNTTWMGRKPRTCRIAGLRIEPGMEGNVAFMRAVFRIKVRPNTWDLRLVEQGFNAIVATDGGYEKVAIQDPKTGAFPSAPALLDGDRDPPNEEQDMDMPGHLRTALESRVTYPQVDSLGRGSYLPAGSKPQYSRWRVKPERNWKLLGI